MPLTITLKPHEKLFINGAILQNGNRSSSLRLENTVSFMRGSDILREQDANTPLKKLYLTLTMLYIDAPDPAIIELFYQQSTEIGRLQPQHAETLLAISEQVEDKAFYKALKLCKQAIALENGPSRRADPAPARRQA